MISTENRETPLLFINYLGALNFLNQWRALHKFFGTVRQKQSTEESWYPYYLKTFDTRTVPKHRRVCPRWFLAMWDKKNWQNCDSPIMQKLLIPEHFWNAEGFAYDVFRRFGTKKTSTEKRETLPLLSINFFHTRTFLKDKSVPPTKLLGILWD